MCNLHSIKVEKQGCVSKNKSRCRDGAVCTCTYGQKTVHPLLGPLCLALYTVRTVVVSSHQWWFSGTSSGFKQPLVPEKPPMAVWIRHCFTVYTNTNIVHFTVNICEVQTPYIQDASGLYSVQSAVVHAPWCTPDCKFWVFRLSSLALQSCTWIYACNKVVYVHGNIWLEWAPVAVLVIAHSQLHYNAQVEKQGTVARPQAWENVGRCRDGENIFQVSTC